MSEHDNGPTGPGEIEIEMDSGALARADLLLLMGDALAPPTEQAVANLLGARSEFGALLKLADTLDDELVAHVVDLFGVWCDELERLGLEGWRLEHNRLFECNVSCPINEASYIRRDKGAILGDVAAFYRAFGFNLREGTGERVDNMACELQFAALLLVMVEQARASGHTENAEIAADALQSFVADHLAEWLLAFCGQLVVSTQRPQYLALSGLLEVMGLMLLRSVGVQPALLGQTVGVEPNPGTPYECGMAADEHA